ncbi:hypothetical protein DBV15_09818 [Temnothorax longispinosus]|uniref:Uncharacterized protein n=1 Tax=Temnothorax longispinosus TaxID=300112 RepID=A0A4S2JSG8_9HYME|nr:hypothetical protein DBV15_09818 [Temnothorax longispinosus]
MRQITGLVGGGEGQKGRVNESPLANSIRTFGRLFGGFRSKGIFASSHASDARFSEIVTASEIIIEPGGERVEAPQPLSRRAFDLWQSVDDSRPVHSTPSAPFLNGPPVSRHDRSTLGAAPLRRAAPRRDDDDEREPPPAARRWHRLALASGASIRWATSEDFIHDSVYQACKKYRSLRRESWMDVFGVFDSRFTRLVVAARKRVARENGTGVPRFSSRIDIIASGRRESKRTVYQRKRQSGATDKTKRRGGNSQRASTINDLDIRTILGTWVIIGRASKAERAGNSFVCYELVAESNSTPFLDYAVNRRGSQVNERTTFARNSGVALVEEYTFEENV